MSWYDALIVIALIPAIGGWLVAAVASVQAFLLVPRGQRLAGYNELSMWNFGKVRQRIGPAGEPVIKRMKQGAMVFGLGLLAVVTFAALSIPFRGTGALP